MFIVMHEVIYELKSRPNTIKKNFNSEYFLNGFRMPVGNEWFKCFFIRKMWELSHHLTIFLLYKTTENSCTNLIWSPI